MGPDPYLSFLGLPLGRFGFSAGWRAPAITFFTTSMAVWTPPVPLSSVTEIVVKGQADGGQPGQ
jgi:hypothetical protein